MDGKKSWIQPVTAGLCVLLLGVTLWQGWKISELEQRLSGVQEALIFNADSANEQMYDLYSTLENLQSVPDRPSLQFQNASVNTEERTLTVDMVAEIPGAEEYSVTVGFCRAGEPYSLAWMFESLIREEDDRFRQTVTFPLDLEMGLEVRTADDTVLYSSETILPLLPLQMKHGGASTHHNSTDGIFSLCDLAPYLTNPAGETVYGVDGVYTLYRNGEIAATQREHGPPWAWEDRFDVPCGLGDRIRLTYTCADEFGLRYEFQLGEWMMVKWDGTRNCPLPPRVAAAWPE